MIFGEGKTVSTHALMPIDFNLARSQVYIRLWGERSNCDEKGEPEVLPDRPCLTSNWIPREGLKKLGLARLFFLRLEEGSPGGNRVGPISL